MPESKINFNIKGKNMIKQSGSTVYYLKHPEEAKARGMRPLVDIPGLTVGVIGGKELSNALRGKNPNKYIPLKNEAAAKAARNKGLVITKNRVGRLSSSGHWTGKSVEKYFAHDPILRRILDHPKYYALGLPLVLGSALLGQAVARQIFKPRQKIASEYNTEGKNQMLKELGFTKQAGLANKMSRAAQEFGVGLTSVFKGISPKVVRQGRAAARNTREIAYLANASKPSNLKRNLLLGGGAIATGGVGALTLGAIYGKKRNSPYYPPQ